MAVFLEQIDCHPHLQYQLYRNFSIGHFQHMIDKRGDYKSNQTISANLFIQYKQ